MHPKKILPLPTARIAGFTLLAIAVATPAIAEAGERTRQITRQRTDTGHVRHDSWSNAAGRTATRSTTVANDRANQTRTRDVTWSGPDGQQATRNAVVVNDRDAGTRSRNVVATGPNGGQRTIDDRWQRTESGYTRSTVVTNPTGAVNTRDVGASYDPETKTWTKEVIVDRTPPATDGD